MRLYEIVCAVRPDIAGDQLDTLSAKLKDIIEKRGGTIVVFDNWGMRKLAYPIDDYYDATYLLVQFSIQPEHITDIKRDLIVNDSLLRYLVIKLDKELGKKKERKKAPAPLSTEPSPNSSDDEANQQSSSLGKGGDSNDRPIENAGTE